MFNFSSTEILKIGFSLQIYYACMSVKLANDVIKSMAPSSVLTSGPYDFYTVGPESRLRIKQDNTG